MRSVDCVCVRLSQAKTYTHIQRHRHPLFMAATNWPLKCYKFNAFWFFRVCCFMWRCLCANQSLGRHRFSIFNIFHFTFKLPIYMLRIDRPITWNQSHIWSRIRSRTFTPKYTENCLGYFDKRSQLINTQLIIQLLSLIVHNKSLRAHNLKQPHLIRINQYMLL